MRLPAKIVVAVLLVAAVGTAALTAFGQASKSATVGVEVKEMRILLSTNRVSAGNVTFRIRNVGSIEHEFVIVRDSGGRLPTRKYKAEEGNRKVDEVEGIAPGKTARLTVNLKRGSYLLICNIPGHYQLGMYARLRAS